MASGSDADFHDLIGAIEKIGVHDHLCLIYESREEQFSTVIPFMKIGLERGERCVYIVDDNTAEMVIDRMKGANIDVENALKSGQLTIANKQDAYLKQGYFDPDWMIDFLEKAANEAKSAGFSALRVTGEMTWMLGGDPGTERLMEYEAKLNYFLPKNDALAICQYNRNSFPPEIIKDVIATHPTVIFGGMVCSNFYYVPPDEFLVEERLSTEIDRLLNNIINRKKVEDELRRYREQLEELVRGRTAELSLMNERFSLATSAARLGVWDWDIQKNELLWDDMMYALYGIKREDFAGAYEAWLQGIHPDDRAFSDETSRRARSGEQKYDTEFRVVWPDGSVHYLKAYGQIVNDANGIPLRMTGINFDITEHKRAEDEVSHLKNYLANIIDSMPSLLVGMDQDGVVTQWNVQAEAATGIPAVEAIRKPIGQLLPDHSPWIEAMRAEISHDHPVSREKVSLERLGERRFYDLMLYPLVTNGMEGTVLRIEDVTERTRIQELMIQTEKMMSVGGLAAGMAHEINNPLAIITQAAQNIERRVSAVHSANQEVAKEAGMSLDALTAYFEQRQIPQFIASIREAADRASRIIANMIRFSSRTETSIAPASLPNVMEQALELAANDYDLKKKYDFRSIEIIRDYQPGLPEVPVVATEIEQVLLNLLKNAAQAMISNPTERKPCITLRIRRKERYAVIEVEDNGPGMTDNIRRRVFEPFFTTKEPGIGTGLGLSVSYMIVTQNHKGLMEVASTPGSGARFTVRLPLDNGQSAGGGSNG